jgi:uncharacterized protein YabE (DUF348 family)
MTELLVLPARPGTEQAPELRPVRLVPVPEPEPEPPVRRRGAALGRPGRVALRAIVVALAVLAPLAAFAGEHHVTVDVEGRTRSVGTYAVTAKQVLQRQGVRVGRMDLVLPAHRLHDGDRVIYRKAKHVSLVVDGHHRRVIARGLTVGEALEDLGLRPGPNDHVYPDPQTKLMPSTVIYVRNAIHAVVRVDGLRRDIVSSADTVRHLLEQANIAVGSHDYVYPSRSSVPYDGEWIRVVRVRYTTESVGVSLPYSYVTRHDPSMESGTSEVVQQGREGLEVDTYSVLIEDGRRVSSSLVGSQIVRRPRDYIVRVGTKAPVFTSHGGSETGEASWFSADGMVAAHRTLPIGSTVKVTNLANGKSVVVTINQRGPYVDGRIIDLSNEAFQQLAPLGAGTIKVRVDT